MTDVQDHKALFDPAADHDIVDDVSKRTGGSPTNSTSRLPRAISN
jgi:hypothetical protein